LEYGGTTVPYPPKRDKIRHNRGFTDLRGRPNKAKRIAEAQWSAALRRLLVRLADPDSPLFSLGCDLGSHKQRFAPRGWGRVAGGYVEVIASNYEAPAPETYQSFAEAVEAGMRTRALPDRWQIEFVIQKVRLKFRREPKGVYPCLWLWFYAGGYSEEEALGSRERLIDAISRALFLPRSLAGLR
jgi:hypothetical protein